MKKLLIGLGLVAAVVAPTAIAITAVNAAPMAHKGVDANLVLRYGRAIVRESHVIGSRAIETARVSHTEWQTAVALHAQGHNLMMVALESLSTPKDRDAIAKCHAASLAQSRAHHDAAVAADMRGSIARLENEAKEARRRAAEVKKYHPKIAEELEAAAKEDEEAGKALARIEGKEIKAYSDRAKRLEKFAETEKAAANRDVPGSCD